MMERVDRTVLLSSLTGEQGEAMLGEFVESEMWDKGTPLSGDVRKRLWISLALTLPILLLSSGLWGMFGLDLPLAFAGDSLVLFLLSTLVFVYGGSPFLIAALHEVRLRRPRMMTLVAASISALYIYSTAVNSGLQGMEFYWELAILIDIMLLGQLLGND